LQARDPSVRDPKRDSTGLDPLWRESVGRDRCAGSARQHEAGEEEGVESCGANSAPESWGTRLLKPDALNELDEVRDRKDLLGVRLGGEPQGQAKLDPAENQGWDGLRGVGQLRNEGLVQRPYCAEAIKLDGEWMGACKQHEKEDSILSKSHKHVGNGRRQRDAISFAELDEIWESRTKGTLKHLIVILGVVSSRVGVD
jgi:hypothetical protein